MRVKVRRRNRYIIGWIALAFVVGLIMVNVVWPKGFAVFIAIGGTAGALMVLYEVRLTKQIAEAEFIRDLQSSFTADANIVELWGKLLLKEKITADDRPLMSSYFTFFETIQLLQDKGALDLGMVDNLFRNRFFTAVGHPIIARETLLKSADAFVNIHELIAVWYEHLVRQSKPVHPGYYRYLEATVETLGFEVVELDPDHLEGVLALQRKVLGALEYDEWLRENSPEMFLECLGGGGTTPRHRSLGILKDGELIAAGVLYDGETGDESIKRYLTDDTVAMRESVNLKLVLTDPEYRRHRFGTTLVRLLEGRALALGKMEILCTIHPKNTPSRRLFHSLGYRRSAKVRTQYGQRLVFARPLRTVSLRRLG